jgi:KipI family sensor histidine kinase inhibitor
MVPIDANLERHTAANLTRSFDFRVFFLGDQALQIISTSVLADAEQIHILHAFCLRLRQLKFVSAAVSALDAITVWLRPGCDAKHARRAVLAALSQFNVKPTSARPRTHRIRFSRSQLDAEFTRDLAELAMHSNLDESAWLKQFCATRFRVAMIGFKPGFPYLIGLARALAMPRLATPRVRVPQGSVAIGGNYAGIYPTPSPGGWRVIGITDAPLFQPMRAEPCLFAPGDQVQFLLQK